MPKEKKDFYCPFLPYNPQGGPRLCPAETPEKENLQWNCPLSINRHCAFYVIARYLEDIVKRSAKTPK